MTARARRADEAPPRPLRTLLPGDAACRKVDYGPLTDDALLCNSRSSDGCSGVPMLCGVNRQGAAERVARLGMCCEQAWERGERVAWLRTAVPA